MGGTHLINRSQFFRKLLISSLICLILFSSFAGSTLGLLTELPDAPARPNTVGPLSGVGGTYGGGVLVLSEKQPNVVADRSKLLGKIEQTDEKRTVEVEEKADWGLSMTGPVSDSEMQGILDAIKDLRPPRKVTLKYELQGVDDERRSWTQTGTVYEVVHHKIYIVRQAVPAQNELVGVMVVETPVDLQVRMDSEPCPDPQPVIDVLEPDALAGFVDAIAGFFNWLFIDLPRDLGLYVFGTVKVYSGGAIAGVMHLRSGESKTIGLPPGSYSVKALVQVFGIPLDLDVGSVSEDVPILLTVSLSTVEYGAVIIVIIIIIIVVSVLYLILKRVDRRYHIKQRIFQRKGAAPQPESGGGKQPGPATMPK